MPSPYLRKGYFHSTMRFLLIAGSLFSVISLAAAQGIGSTVNGETATPIPGAGHDYIHLLSETVDPSSGQVSVHINLPVPKGRGLTFPFSINYSSAGVNRLDSPTVAGPLAWTPESFSGGNPYGQGGWGYSYLPKLSSSTWSTTNSPTTTQISCLFYSNYTFTDASGTGHNLGLGYNVEGGTGLSGDDGGYIIGGCAGPGTAGNVTGGGDSEVTAYMQSNNLEPGAIVVEDLDGTIYNWIAGTTQGAPPLGIEDRNGNKISNILWPTNGYPLGYTDTLGRNIVSVTGTGASGTTDTVIVGPLHVQVKWTSITTNYSVPSKSFLPQSGSNIGCGSPSVPSPVVATQNVISEIDLPNQQKYTFTYDQHYGLLTQITYPDGGWVKYTWTTSVGGTYSELGQFGGYNMQPDYWGIYGPVTVPGACVYQYTPPVVATREVNFGSANSALLQTFAFATSWPESLSDAVIGGWLSKSVQVQSKDEVTNLTSTKVYTYSPLPINQGPYAISYGGASMPVEQSVVSYDWNGSVLDVETKGWFDQFELACDFHSINGMPALTSGHFYQYRNGQVSDDKEYDFGQIANPSLTCTGRHPGAPSSPTPAREVKTTFTPPFTNPIAAGFGAPLTYWRPQTEKILAYGMQEAETDYGYDNYSLFSLASPSASNHDPSFSSSVTTRGNVTSVVHVCTGCSSPTMNYGFDITGQVRAIQDPLGHTTLYSYADQSNAGGANPTGISNAYLTVVTDPFNMTKKYYWNYPTGEVTQSTDENGQSTTYSYGGMPSNCSAQDYLDRLTEITYPDGGDTQYCFNDVGPQPSVTTFSLLNMNGPSWKSNIDTRDGMGHVTQTSLTSDPEADASGDMVDTTYDGEGHVLTVSNPHRTGRSPTDGVTTFAYDAVGRKIKQVDSDRVSVQQWCYDGIASQPAQTNCRTQAGSQSGTWVDSQDENGNNWQRTSNSFGNLLDVIEPNGASKTPAMETDYTYDALNNLLSVRQFGNGLSDTPRQRTFTYNSLSQLLSASNPESGSVGYTYDLDGNVLTKTDARGVATNYSYDLVNHLLSKSYSNDPSATPSSCYQYGSTSTATTNGIERLVDEWTQRASAGACAATPPATGIIAQRFFSAYDPMGRLQNEQQATLASPLALTKYSPQYTYDRAGNLLSSTSGLGPKVISAYSTAGRLQTVTSQWPANQQLFSAQAAGSSTCPSSTPIPAYAPGGQLVNAQLGNGLLLNRSYDSRLRFACESDTGGMVISPAYGSASVTITGVEQSK